MLKVKLVNYNRFYKFLEKYCKMRLYNQEYQLLSANTKVCIKVIFLGINPWYHIISITDRFFNTSDMRLSTHVISQMFLVIKTKHSIWIYYVIICHNLNVQLLNIDGHYWGTTSLKSCRYMIVSYFLVLHIQISNHNNKQPNNNDTHDKMKMD